VTLVKRIDSAPISAAIFLRIYTGVNFHEKVVSPRMMKENLGAARGCLMSCKSIGALS
jgi:hypothetical protein